MFQERNLIFYILFSDMDVHFLRIEVDASVQEIECDFLHDVYEINGRGFQALSTLFIIQFFVTFIICIMHTTLFLVWISNGLL